MCADRDACPRAQFRADAQKAWPVGLRVRHLDALGTCVRLVDEWVVRGADLAVDFRVLYPELAHDFLPSASEDEPARGALRERRPQALQRQIAYLPGRGVASQVWEARSARLVELAAELQAALAY